MALQAPGVIPVVVDVSSAQRLLDMAKTVYGFGVGLLVAAKVYGSAATNGVPEAWRIAMKHKASLVVLPGLRDAVSLFNPDKVIVFSYEYGDRLGLDELGGLMRGGRVMVVFGGIDAAPSREDVNLGRAVYFKGVDSRLPPSAEASLALYAYRTSSR